MAITDDLLHARAEERKSRRSQKKRFWAVLIGCLGVGAGIAIGLSWKSITTSSSSSSDAAATPVLSPPPASLLPTTAVSQPGIASPNPNRPIFMFIGDSITQLASDVVNWGFAARLSAEFVRSVDVVNRGLAAYNTTAFVSRALPILGEELTHWVSPALITVWFGVADAAVVGGRHESEHVPVAQYRDNLVTILKQLQKLAPHAKLLLLTPAPVDDNQRRADLVKSGSTSKVLDRTNNHTALYAQACRDVMKSVANVTLVDTYKYFMETYPNVTQRGEFLSDGLHWSPEGHRVVYELLQKEIKVVFPNLTQETNQVPEWRGLNDFYPKNQPNRTRWL